MKPLTNESYYTILEKCTIEAFECLDLKELYPDNGAKAVWDVSGFYTQSDRLINEIIKESYIKENMRTTFLMALDRHWKQFEKKHEITRDYFYKKCFQALLLKTSQDTSWNKPDFGFDINAEPCKLNFIWNMRFDIEARSIKHQTVKAVSLDTIKKELHNDIFKYNAFEVFEKYKENKQMNVNSRTDLRVIFELLKNDGLLLETIELKHYIKWLNRVYFDGAIVELKNQNIKSKPNIQRTNDYKEYKTTTLKQP